MRKRFLFAIAALVALLGTSVAMTPPPAAITAMASIEVGWGGENPTTSHYINDEPYPCWEAGSRMFCSVVHTATPTIGQVSQVNGTTHAPEMGYPSKACEKQQTSTSTIQCWAGTEWRNGIPGFYWDGCDPDFTPYWSGHTWASPTGGECWHVEDNICNEDQ